MELAEVRRSARSGLDELIPDCDVPEGQSGPWVIERFEITEAAAEGSGLKKAMNTGRKRGKR